ncbi:MAG: hypothetical protein ACOYK6_03555 [Chthoniobacterales bacterium]
MSNSGNTSFSAANVNRRHNLFSNIESEIHATWRDVGASAQEKFEEDLERIITGKDLLRYQVNEKATKPITIKKTLDGRDMLASLAEGKITFPLEPPSLRDVSLQEISGALSFALRDNIEELDQKIAELAPNEESEQDPTNFRSSVQYLNSLEEYKKILERGCSILISVQDLDFVNHQSWLQIIHSLNKVFASFSSDLVNETDSVIPENHFFLKKYALALLGSIEEGVRPDSNPNGVYSYKKILILFEQALAIEEKGYRSPNDRYLKKVTAMAHLLLREELARPDPRENIIYGCRESLNLLQQIRNDMFICALDSFNGPGMAQVLLVEEQARPHPRENIIRSYQKSLEFYKFPFFVRNLNLEQGNSLVSELRARVEAGDNIDLSVVSIYLTRKLSPSQYRCYRGKGLAQLMLTQEQSRPYPREDIIYGYKESIHCFDRSLTNPPNTPYNHARCFERKGWCVLGITNEQSRDHPRADIINDYSASLSLLDQSIGLGNGRSIHDREKLTALRKQGSALLERTNARVISSPKKEVIAFYHTLFECFKNCSLEYEVGHFEQALLFYNQGEALWKEMRASQSAGREPGQDSFCIIS